MRTALLAALVLCLPAPAGAELPPPRPAAEPAPAAVAARPRAIVAARAAPAAARPAAPARATARVTYLAGASIYLDAGRDDGLLVGDSLAVRRDSALVAVLRVTFLSSHRASCEIARGSGELRPGDVARFTAHAIAPPAAPADSAAKATPVAKARPRPHWLRGRLGVRYLDSRDPYGKGPSFRQPALDLRLDGGGAGYVDLSADVRARRTYRPDPATNDERARVYRLSLSLHDARVHRLVTAGRQVSGALAGVNIFDGVLAENTARRWNMGAFAGTQPDERDFGWSGAVREVGGYVQLHTPPLTVRRWSLTAGWISSKVYGQVNRDFAYLDGQVFTPRFNASVTQEVDYNRGWKTALGEPVLSPTSTFATLRADVLRFLSVNGGFDNRRRVRLYRDRVTPETDFDDAYRQGVWGGMSLRLLGRARLGLDARSSAGGAGSGASAFSANLDSDPLTRLRLGLRTRGTRYANERTAGWLWSGGLGFDLGALAHLEFSGGRREESDRVTPTLGERVTWTGFDTDVHVARRLYLLYSLEHDRSTATNFNQQYASLSWRF